MNTELEYEVYSHTDELLYTSPHEDLARRFARTNAPTYPGLYIVERVTRRRRLWTDRQHMRVCA